MRGTEEKKTSLWSLFITFAKVGVMTFGGGYAMLPILEREVVTNRGWATSEEMLDYYAIGQCTPGIIAVNVATFTGIKERGFLGGVIATDDLQPVAREDDVVAIGDVQTVVGTQNAADMYTILAPQVELSERASHPL